MLYENSDLGIPLDAPKISNLVINLNRLGLFALRFFQPSFYCINVDVGGCRRPPAATATTTRWVTIATAFFGLLFKEVGHLRLRDVAVRGPVLDADQVVVIGKVHRLPAIQHLQRKIYKF